ncbi:MAG: NYN domain-containing protein [Phycisphaerales bacterium]|nr:NYN domain-containing protein [Phycisphaerales bacterium]
MSLIVDALNLLHVWSSGPVGALAVELEALAERIGRSRYAGRRVRLVCDGHGPAGEAGAVPLRRIRGAEVLFAGLQGEDADAVIERLILADHAPRRLLVVSSDRRILKAARRRRAATMTSQGFAAQLSADAARGPAESARPPFAEEVPLDIASTAFWMRELGFGEPPTPHPAPRPRPDPARTPPPINAPGGGPVAPAPPPPRPEPRPELADLLRALGGAIRPEDLDMQRWLEHTPDIPAREPRPAADGTDRARRRGRNRPGS